MYLFIRSRLFEACVLVPVLRTDRLHDCRAALLLAFKGHKGQEGYP